MGCTETCVPRSAATTHRLKIYPSDKDEPDMKSFDGSKLDVVGQTKLYRRIKGSKSKKMFHALVVAESYDREILLSWVDCLSCGIVANQFSYPSEDSEDEEVKKDNGTSSTEQPEIIQDVNNDSVGDK